MEELEKLDVSKLHSQSFRKAHPDYSSDSFVSEYIGMVEAIAGNLISKGKVPSCLEFQDLVSFGIEGLLKAKKNFKEDKGSRFSTYAFYRVKGEMLDRIRLEWKHRNPVEHDHYRKRLKERVSDAATEFSRHSDDSSFSSQDSVHSLIQSSTMVYVISTEELDVESNTKGTKNPEIEIVDENHSVLWEEIQKLEGDERLIVELFYVQGLKQVDIADKLGYSRSKVCRVHMSLLNKLRLRLGERYNEA